MKTFPNSFFVNVKSKKRLLFLMERFYRPNTNREQYIDGLAYYKKHFCVRLMKVDTDYCIVGFAHRIFYTVYNEYPEVISFTLYKYAIAHEIIQAIQEKLK